MLNPIQRRGKSSMQKTLPEHGQLAEVRQRHYVVLDVLASGLSSDMSIASLDANRLLAPAVRGPAHERQSGTGTSDPALRGGDVPVPTSKPAPTPAGGASDIDTLRQLHIEMDRAVSDAYGWTDLGHDFHETRQGIRFTVSEPARREILDRLLALNHHRHQQELEQGLQDRAKTMAPKAKGTRKKTNSEQGELF